MKKIILILVGLTILSCDNSDNIITEPIAFSEFYINNESNTNLVIEYTFTDNFINSNKSVNITSTELNLLYKASDISILKPADVFNELKIYTEKSGTLNLVVTISSIVNSDWLTTTNEETTIENTTIYKLTITDQTLI